MHSSDHDLAMSGLAHSDKPVKSPKKEVQSIHARKATKGYVVEHHHNHPEHHKMEEHAVANKKALLAHMEEHMPEPGGPAEEAGESGGEQAQEQALGIE